jgi:hypothetical protein
MNFKNIFYCLFLSSVLVFSSCTDPDIVTKAEENLFNTAGSIISATDVTSGFFDLGDIPNAIYSSTLVANGADVSNADILLSRNGGDEVTISSVSSFPSEFSLTLEDAASALGISTDDVAVGDNFGLRFVSTSGDGTFSTGTRVGVLATCSSALAGEYAYVLDAPFCGGDAVMGTVMLTETMAGRYTFSDWAFGSYEVCYGGPAASWGSLELTDVCNTLAIEGVDNYDDTWYINDIATSGDQFTFTWSNDYGESGTVTLTNPNGDWPPLK